MSMDAIKFELSKYAPIIKPSGATPSPVEAPSQDKTSFANMFSNAIKEVDNLQKQADQHIEGLILDKKGATTHGAMLALEKADIAFQLMNNIRAKLVRAYEEVIRTPV